jgi:chromosome partitioning protein
MEIDMAGLIIVVGKEKGGVGASTLVKSLAAAFAERGVSVAAVDMDEGQSVTTWGRIRSEAAREGDAFVSVSFKSGAVERDLIDMADRYDVVLVDLGARDYERIKSMALICDYWVLPTGVGMDDLHSTLRVSAFLKTSAAPFRPSGKMPFGIVVCKAPVSSSEGVQAFAYLLEHGGGAPVCDFMIKDRKVWRDAAILGQGITEMPVAQADKAQAEFMGVFNYMVNSINGTKEGSK